MKTAAQPNWDHDDAFLPYRNRIIYSLAIASVIIFLPFAVDHFLEGRLALGVATLSIVLILTIDAFAIHHDRHPPIPLWMLVFPVLATLGFALITPLYMDLAWANPAIILFYFVLPPRIANWLAGLIVAAVVVPAHFAFLGTPYHMRVTTRLGATLALTAILSNLFFNLIFKLQRQLQRQTIVDPLTGAFNRRHMDTILGDAHARASRGAAAPSLLLFDIDHFKRINDEFGHGTGDDVLKQVVACIQHHVRSSDALFRSGGEEFILFLPETPLAGALNVAEQIRRSVAECPMLESRPVTISIGVATLLPGETLDDWLRHGDNALYQAKSEGRNRVCQRVETALMPAAG